MKSFELKKIQLLILKELLNQSVLSNKTPYPDAFISIKELSTRLNTDETIIRECCALLIENNESGVSYYGVDKISAHEDTTRFYLDSNKLNREYEKEYTDSKIKTGTLNKFKYDKWAFWFSILSVVIAGVSLWLSYKEKSQSQLDLGKLNKLAKEDSIKEIRLSSLEKDIRREDSLYSFSKTSFDSIQSEVKKGHVGH